MPAVPRAPERPVPPSLQALGIVAGLAGGGLLLLGIVLLVLQIGAPLLIGGATGPGWGRVVLHLAVGGLAETGHALRRRLPVAAGALIAALTVLAVLAVLVLAWWW
jgi:hypothetical protein